MNGGNYYKVIVIRRGITWPYKKTTIRDVYYAASEKDALRKAEMDYYRNADILSIKKNNAA